MPSPRVVRNFWLSADVDGRQSRITGGPRARDGGVSLTLYQRSNGSVATALTVLCRASCDGTLSIEVEPALPYRFSRTDRTIKIETKR